MIDNSHPNNDAHPYLWCNARCTMCMHKRERPIQGHVPRYYCTNMALPIMQQYSRDFYDNPQTNPFMHKLDLKILGHCKLLDGYKHISGLDWSNLETLTTLIQ
jgi:hypothetical protein